MELRAAYLNWDRHTCQYWLAPATTVDHVIRRAAGTDPPHRIWSLPAKTATVPKAPKRWPKNPARYMGSFLNP